MASRPGAFARSPPRGRGAGVVALFSAALFLSAGLTFLVQPMFAKFVLPLFGNTPAVWNSSMLFFQTTLLLGLPLRAREHASSRRQLGRGSRPPPHPRGACAVPQAAALSGAEMGKTSNDAGQLDALRRTARALAEV